MAPRAKRPKARSKPKARRSKSKPERSLYERLRDHPIEPLRLDLNPQQLAELRRQEALLREARPKSLQEGRRLLDRALAAEVWGSRPRQEDGPQVRFAKELLAATFPRNEWRTMTIKVVRHVCASEAEARGRRLPSPDSFARAMGRRRR